MYQACHSIYSCCKINQHLHKLKNSEMHTINVLLLQRMHKQFFLRHFFKQRSSYRDCVCVQTPVTSLKKSKDKLIMLINITNHLHYTQCLHYIFINTSLQTSLSWSSFSIEFTREVEDEA